MAPSAQAPPSKAYSPMWLKMLVIVMGLLIVAGFVVIAAEIARRMSSASSGRPPAGTAFAERIGLPAGAQVISMMSAGDRLVVHVETQDGLVTAYFIDPRSGALVGTVAFPPGAPR